MTLPQAPRPPAGVERALALPRTVLYADLGLRGNLRSRLQQVLDIDYEPSYISFNGPDIRWNYTSDSAFDDALYRSLPLADGVSRFLAAMQTTSRLLLKVAAMVSASATRRAGNVDDLYEDLVTYWNARELHTTNLFTFWNVEHRVSTALAELTGDLPSSEQSEERLTPFLQPNEANYFLLEQYNLNRIVDRFGSPSATLDDTSSISRDLLEAMAAHIEQFGFLVAPFRARAPGTEALLTRLPEDDRLATDLRELEATIFRVRGDPLTAYPEQLRTLGLLGQQIAFWKTERIDVMALADYLVIPLYHSAAHVLGISPEEFLLLTRKEIEDSLANRSLRAHEPPLADRQERYCLVLHDGRIAFYAPTESTAGEETIAPAKAGDTLQGTPTSAGITTGRVVVFPDPFAVIRDPGEAERLEEGDILVTTMTRPEMGTVLTRAGAWVTDEGGRVSHAAILSRELRKPCVTAVPHATARLQDGMIVTVDGLAGSVAVERSPE